jgi:hypothetical protein
MSPNVLPADNDAALGRVVVGGQGRVTQRPQQWLLSKLRGVERQIERVSPGEVSSLRPHLAGSSCRSRAATAATWHELLLHLASSPCSLWRVMLRGNSLAGGPRVRTQRV